MRKLVPLLLVASAFLALATTSCSNGTPGPPAPDPDADSIPAGFNLDVELVANGFSNPVLLTAPVGDARHFIVDQPGTIRIVQNGSLLSTPFLDIRNKVRFSGEQGLLGLAFHPEYATNGRFYVNYTDLSGNTRVERYNVSPANMNTAEISSAQLVLGVDQPFTNHNGGMITFAPDGTLLIGMGDGGNGGDPLGHGQNRASLLGALLRIDVSQEPYVIPPDNPYAEHATFRREIWAYGLRNPWRFSIDRVNGRLYIADVGQNRLEEIDVADLESAGLDYGWNVLEGSECYNAPTCDRTGRVAPVLEYGRDDGCSVIGGYVYSGSALPEVAGRYFYSDYCTGWLRSFRLLGGEAREGRQWEVGNLGRVLSLGEDAAGELYVLTANGSVYRIIRG